MENNNKQIEITMAIGNWKIWIKRILIWTWKLQIEEMDAQGQAVWTWKYGENMSLWHIFSPIIYIYIYNFNVDKIGYCHLEDKIILEGVGFFFKKKKIDQLKLV